jgi:carbon storage regulator
MLVLTRKPGEKVVIGENIVLTVIKAEGNQVRLAFEAPDQVRILREELRERRDRPAAVRLRGIEPETITPGLVLDAPSPVDFLPTPVETMR